MAGQDALKAEATTKPVQNGHSSHEHDVRPRILNLNELVPELQTNILKHVSSLITHHDCYHEGFNENQISRPSELKSH
jgi:hypothetical protein